MKTYKYYLVVNPEDAERGFWMYGFFEDFEKAKDFADHLMLPDVSRLEVLGTDEEPDLYITATTLYKTIA